MNELFDKLILRIFLAIFICFLLWLYKYLHVILYPVAKEQTLSPFSPLKNTADTIHLFARLIGLGIVFSEFQFYLSDGVLYAIIEFIIHSLSAYSIFLISVWIMDSIALYNFDYHDEIHKRRNVTYATVGAANVLAIGYLIKTVLQVSQGSFIALIFLWLLSVIAIGIAAKAYSWVSLLAFNKNIIQKNMGIAFSYSGFILGWSLIIATSLESDAKSFRWYATSVVLQILLSLIIYPLFHFGLGKVFKIQHDFNEKDLEGSKGKESEKQVAYGFYEGASFLTACLLTSLIIGHIHFGTFYPIF